ncbi:hypothetical protein OG589_34335 [Sphaerisporangium sp. NBC_01403]|uniref:hypothetical protein n=1 Tax=Sphaerisporangium sp. NBC_01403 TaxID=2903599 RepID=UPI0032454E06
MPAATVVPDLADTAGRHGVGASIRYEGPDGWERAEFIFERETYRFLGWRTWIERGTEETMLGGTAVLAIKVVDSMPEVPKNAGKPAFC